MGDATEVCAVNTMYRKTTEKQATYMTPQGDKKQLDVSWRRS